MSRTDAVSPFAHKIRPRHCDRLAVVYVRQSTPQQVAGNRESTDLQYQLRRRAVALGWADDPDAFLQRPGRLPFVALVGSPADDDAADVLVRLYAVGRMHRSIAVTAVAAVGAAAALDRSVVSDRLRRPFAELAREAGQQDVTLRVAHAAGLAEIRVGSTESADGVRLPRSLRYLRTARRLMQGEIFV